MSGWGCDRNETCRIYGHYWATLPDGNARCGWCHAVLVRVHNWQPSRLYCAALALKRIFRL